MKSAAMMMTPQVDPLSEWITIVGSLSNFQQLKLIGLLTLNSDLQPAFINETLIQQSENTAAAEVWLKKNLREVMYFYCKHSGSFQVQGALTLVDKSEIVKQLAPLLLATYSLPLGIAVGFLFWALNRYLTNWCMKYAVREYGGRGSYFGSFSANGIDGFMDIKHKPAIDEVEQDVEAAPLDIKFIRIVVPAETKGRIDLGEKETVDRIATSQLRGDAQTFSLVDNETKKSIKGSVHRAYVSTAREPTLLKFDAQSLEGL